MPGRERSPENSHAFPRLSLTRRWWAVFGKLSVNWKFWLKFPSESALAARRLDLLTADCSVIPFGRCRDAAGRIGGPDSLCFGVMIRIAIDFVPGR
ncbi:hypothetical protein [Crateriforma conspicua]|uniref:hypothetical protein n=1 Tax=Crateriforma spongiae TaxID=2724528 RepID=UPI0018CF3B96